MRAPEVLLGGGGDPVAGQVIVHCRQVKKPVGIRYAWANNPAHANLYNKEGLPASPFEAYLDHSTPAPR